MSTLDFIKMHGLGNDFVVIDGRLSIPDLSVDAIQAIADRRTGVGFDQLIVLEPSDKADVFMRIFNADGSESAACGNAARCIAQHVMAETGTKTVDVETLVGVLETRHAGANRISVDMGPVSVAWQDIPLAREEDTLRLPIESEGLREPVAVNVGNPHMIFFVDDVGVAPIDELGFQFERHALFPQRTNVQMAEIVGYDRIQLKTWERGVGRTRASGSGACATLAAAHLIGHCGRSADVIMDGGPLSIQWRDDNRIIQTGPSSVSYKGTLDDALLDPGDAP